MTPEDAGGSWGPGRPLPPRLAGLLPPFPPCPAQPQLRTWATAPSVRSGGNKAVVVLPWAACKESGTQVRDACVQLCLTGHETRDRGPPAPARPVLNCTSLTPTKTLFPNKATAFPGARARDLSASLGTRFNPPHADKRISGAFGMSGPSQRAGDRWGATQRPSDPGSRGARSTVRGQA